MVGVGSIDPRTALRRLNELLVKADDLADEYLNFKIQMLDLSNKVYKPENKKLFDLIARHADRVGRAAYDFHDKLTPASAQLYHAIQGSKSVRPGPLIPSRATEPHPTQPEYISVGEIGPLIRERFKAAGVRFFEESRKGYVHRDDFEKAREAL